MTDILATTLTAPVANVVGVALDTFQMTVTTTLTGHGGDETATVHHQMNVDGGGWEDIPTSGGELTTPTNAVAWDSTVLVYTNTITLQSLGEGKTIELRARTNGDGSGELLDPTSGWLTVTINAGPKTATGSPSVFLPTATGVAKVINTSSGSPSVFLPTSSGVARIIKKAAVGIATLALITSSGTADADASTTHFANGAPSILLPTAAGAAKVIRKATGSPSVFLPTATGVAEVINTSSGAPEIILPTSSGGATITRKSSGAVNIFLPTAAGVANADVGGGETATGAPSIFLPTASGAAFIWPKVYLNTTKTLIGAIEMTVTAANAAGTSITFNDPVGAPIGNIWLGVENRVNGDVGWIAVTVTAGPDNTATGAPSIFLPTASGVAEVIKTADGSPSVYLPTVSGAAKVIKTASGAPTLPLIESAGAASLTRKSSGAPSIALIEASGAAARVLTSSGAPTLPLITSAGIADVPFFSEGRIEIDCATYTINITASAYTIDIDRALNTANIAGAAYTITIELTDLGEYDIEIDMPLHPWPLA